jgi:crotonobetainyl-CoA:carnitine CoA-transferase CaiB-like acyl-CoA transferase
MATSGLLDGLQVLEVAEGVAGPMCGKVFADLGATVTRVEPPWGDWLRQLAPEGSGGDAIYRQLNAGKEILSLDLTTPAARERLHALAARSDACIVGERLSKLPKLGLSYVVLKQIAPHMVYCHVSGWGSSGPMADRAASELTVQVVAGLTRYLGLQGGAPIRQGFDLVSVDTGIAAAQAVLAALLWRNRSGEGQYVEVSMLATAIALMQWDTAAESGPDQWEGRQLSAHEWPADHGYQCADTRCLIDLHGDAEAWSALLREIGYPDLADDPRFSTVSGLDLHLTELPRLTAGRLSTWPFKDLERLVRDKYGGTIVPMLSLSEVISHPQIRHIGIIQEGPIPRVRFPMDAR